MLLFARAGSMGYDWSVGVVTLLLVPPDPRLLRQGGLLVRIVAATGALVGIRLRVPQQIGRLIADLAAEAERYPNERVDAAQLADDVGPHLAYDASLIDPPAIAELVLRPEEAPSARVPGGLREPAPSCHFAPTRQVVGGAAPRDWIGRAGSS